MFGGAYRRVCLLIFKIWLCTLRGSWFRSVSTWGIEEGSIWSISNWILLVVVLLVVRSPWKIGPKNPLDYVDPYHLGIRFIGFLTVIPFWDLSSRVFATGGDSPTHRWSVVLVSVFCYWSCFAAEKEKEYSDHLSLLREIILGFSLSALDYRLVCGCTVPAGKEKQRTKKK